MSHHLDLDTITLAHGAHRSPDQGVCLLEAVAWWAEEAHTDHPVCVSPALGAFGRNLNDVLPDGKRQELRSLIPLLPGTADDGLDEFRGYMALDWLIRTWTPAWLDLAGLTVEAAGLRDFRRIADLAAVQQVRPHVLAARDKAAAAGDAAGSAAGDAAGSAAGDAAGSAAGDAAWDAAGDAAWDAAWNAAWNAARNAARDAAWDAAWDAARDAAWDAARDAAWDAAWNAARNAARDAAGDAAGDAAWNAAGDVLQPTVGLLQDSAIDLYRDMIHAAADKKASTP